MTARSAAETTTTAQSTKHCSAQCKSWVREQQTIHMARSVDGSFQVQLVEE